MLVRFAPSVSAKNAQPVDNSKRMIILFDYALGVSWTRQFEPGDRKLYRPRSGGARFCSNRTGPQPACGVIATI